MGQVQNIAVILGTSFCFFNKPILVRWKIRYWVHGSFLQCQTQNNPFLRIRKL